MKDIPKSLVVILLILVIVISVLGTWTVLDEIEKAQNVPTQTGTAPASAVGKVRFTIGSPEEVVESSVTGKVVLKIGGE